MMRKSKQPPLLYDPLIITRVKQYLEDNVHQTYVDVAVMAKELQERYKEYSRRKTVPFRILVEQAYKTVLHSYGLDSNPSSDNDADGNSDLELMDEENAEINHMNDTMNTMYMNNKVRSAPTNSGEAIDISSDESEDEEKSNGEKPVNNKTLNICGVTITKVKNPQCQAATNKIKGPPNPVAPQHISKKRKLDTVSSEKVPQMNPLRTVQFAKKFKSVGITPKYSDLNFNDVGGLEKTLKELCELLLHLKHPEVYEHIGLPPPRGFLLHGPPGCGKTLLARAIAGQLNVPLLEVTATELIAGVSGESEERIRDLFQQAAALAPCVLFIDEVDAISSNRLHAQKDMERRVVTQLLSSLDGLSKEPNGVQVLVIGATNRADAIDPALRRVGRFDQEICLGIPDKLAREQILTVLCENLKLERPFEFEKLAMLTPGYVGADLLALATRAASTAVKRAFSIKEEAALKKKFNNEIAMSENLTVVNLTDESILMDVEELPDIPKESNLPTETSIISLKENGETSSIRQLDEQNTEKVIEKIDNDDNNVITATETKMDEVELKITETNTTENDDVIKEAAETTTDLKLISAVEPEIIEDNNVEIEKEESLGEAVLKQPGMKLQLTLSEMMTWLSDKSPPIAGSELANLCITMKDFQDALKCVQPSAKREGFITVPDTTWDDIGSLRDIREELKLAILAPVKFPEKLKILGLEAPSGVLLCGPPGCGKTLLAKAVANEAGINFISVKGPELLNMYVGESERAVRQCFQRARNSAPCVIFFDEFDSLCPKRSDTGESGAGMRVVNQLLTEMDGIEDRKGVFLMAASNRPDMVDPAVLRPGRLDKILYVGLPKNSDRADILRALTKNGTKPKFSVDVNIDVLSNLTNGYSGADLAGLVRQASLHALKDSITNSDSSDNSNELEVSNEHFTRALEQTNPSVSLEDQKHYEKLRLKYAAPNQQKNITI